MPKKDNKKPKKKLYTVRKNMVKVKANPINLKAGGGKKKKPKKKGGSTGRYGKQRRTTPRLHYAPIVPGIPENKAMRGWGEKKCKKQKRIHDAPVEYEKMRAGRKKQKK